MNQGNEGITLSNQERQLILTLRAWENKIPKDMPPEERLELPGPGNEFLFTIAHLVLGLVVSLEPQPNFEGDDGIIMGSGRTFAEAWDEFIFNMASRSLEHPTN
jgi:hypothetical protein